MDNYWDDIEDRLLNLKKEGFVKLKSLHDCNFTNFIESEVFFENKSVYREQTSVHLNLLNKMQVENYLTPKLFNFAYNELNYKGSISDQYHVTRIVNPGDPIEQYRTHFDSHLFTLVLPIRIPKVNIDKNCGELLYYPKARLLPRNEITNLIGKIYFKKFANKRNVEILVNNNHMLIENFENLEPLLFMGNVTLHANKEVDKSAEFSRITFLSHFFDPFSKYGIGKLFRIMRSR